MSVYNERYPSKPMNLVIFDDALRHLLRVTRIINSPSGNCLLVGVGGSGKQSLTKLAAFICKQNSERLDRLLERAWRWSTRRWRRVGGALGESMSSLGTIERYVQDRYPSVTGMSYQRFREVAWQIQHGVYSILTLHFVTEPEPAWGWFGLDVWEPEDRH